MQLFLEDHDFRKIQSNRSQESIDVYFMLLIFDS